MPIGLDHFLGHIPLFVLVMTRLSGIFGFAPVFGSRAIPIRIKALFVFGLSLCVYPSLTSVISLDTPVGGSADGSGFGVSLWALPAWMLFELLIELAIGFGASLPLVGFQLSGRVADQQLGLGLAGIFNPELNEDAGVIGQFFYIIALTLFVIVGGHRLLVGTVIESFQHVPLAGFDRNGDVVSLTVGLLTSMFTLAIQVAAPLLCVIFLMTIGMGFIARTVPQMNILSIGFPLRILLGSCVLLRAVSVNVEVFLDTLNTAMDRVSELVAT